MKEMKSFEQYYEAEKTQVTHFKSEVNSLADEGENSNQIATIGDSSVSDLDALARAMTLSVGKGKEEGDNFQIAFSFNYIGSLYEGMCLSKDGKIYDFTLDRNNEPVDVKSGGSINDLPDIINNVLKPKDKEGENDGHD